MEEDLFMHKLQWLLMNELNHSLQFSKYTFSLTYQIKAAFPYFELHHVSWLNNEFPGGESVVSLVFLFVWPVEVEGWIAAESCRPDCVGVEAPVLFVGGTFC